MVVGERKKMIDEITLELPIPENIETYDQFKEYLWDEFHIDLVSNPDDDFDLNLFYNDDLRSIMGHLWELDPTNHVATLILWPQYYIKFHESYWNKLIKACGVAKEGI